MAIGLQVPGSSISSTPQYVQDTSSNNSSLAISNGDIGVGTNSPADPLDVKGNLRITATGDSYPTAQILDFDHNNVSLNFDSYYDTAWRSSNVGSNYRIYKVDSMLMFSYATGVGQGSTITAWSSELNNVSIAIKNNGNVGIGTTSNATQLEVNGVVTLDPAATPSNPSSSNEARVYIKGGKFIIQYNDAGTTRYKYLSLTGTGVTWVQTTTAP